MVQLEEVEDQELSQAQPGPVKDEDYDSADFVDTGNIPNCDTSLASSPLQAMKCSKAEEANNPQIPSSQTMTTTKSTPRRRNRYQSGMLHPPPPLPKHTLPSFLPSFSLLKIKADVGAILA